MIVIKTEMKILKNKSNLPAMLSQKALVLLDVSFNWQWELCSDIGMQTWFSLF